MLQAQPPAPAARVPGQVQGGDTLLHLLLNAAGGLLSHGFRFWDVGLMA